MPTWKEICQLLDDLRVLIQETEEEISDPVTTHERRLKLEHFLEHCRATWEEIMDKDGDVSPLG